MTERKKRLIFWVMYLAYSSIYVARVNLSMAGPDLIAGKVLDTVQLGLLGSIFSTVYATGRLFNGSLGDKTPPWLMMTVGLGAAGLSNILIGFLPPFLGIFLLWTCNAYAQSMIWSSVLCVVSALYDGEIAKKKTSLMVTSVAMGNILSILLNTFLVVKFGAEFAFLVPGGITVLLGAGVFFATRNIHPETKTEEKHLSLWKLLGYKEVLSMGVPAIIHGVMKENISLWMTAFVVSRYMVDLSTSSYYILLIPVIGFVGRILYPVAFKVCGYRENVVSMIGFMVCIVASALLCFGGLGVLTAVILLSLIYTAVSVINTSILSIFPLQYLKTGNVASVSGVMDFATYLGGGLSGVIYGLVIDRFGYNPMFMSWVVISVISFLMLGRMNRKDNHELA